TCDLRSALPAVPLHDALPIFGQPLPDLPEGTRVATWLNDEALRQLLPEAGRRRWVIGLLPHPEMPNARFGFGIASRLEQAQEDRSEEHTSELQSRENLVCRLL